LSQVDGLNLGADLFGIAGSIFLALAFLKRERLRKIAWFLGPDRHPRDTAARRLSEQASTDARDLIEALAPANYAKGLVGTLLLVLSFVAKLAASIMVMSSDWILHHP
jgi:hypothetical protein